MEISNDMLAEIKYVKQSKYRTKVFEALDGYPKMPNEIAKKADIVPNHVSVTLKQLKKHGLVECMNPEVRKGRLYRLTEKGESVRDAMEQSQL